MGIGAGCIHCWHDTGEPTEQVPRHICCFCGLVAKWAASERHGRFDPAPRTPTGGEKDEGKGGE